MWSIGEASPTQSLLLISLLVVIVLLVVQTLRLHRRNQEVVAATQTLLQREKLATLGQMMTGIAHELNTPLGAVCCSVDTRQKAVAMIDEAVTDLATPDADAAAQLARMQKALDALHTSDPILNEALTRINQLIRELRLTGRGEADAPEPVDVNELVRGTLLLLHHELKHGVEIVLELGDVRPVPGWPGPLGQVFLNLVMNARQAVGDGGQITISTAMAGDQVVITVADDGPGLPAGRADQIFKPGFTTKSSADGTGLGLFITNKITHRHRGRIEATDRQGGGAEFTVTLPTSRSDHGPQQD